MCGWVRADASSGHWIDKHQPAADTAAPMRADMPKPRKTPAPAPTRACPGCAGGKKFVTSPWTCPPCGVDSDTAVCNAAPHDGCCYGCASCAEIK